MAQNSELKIDAIPPDPSKKVLEIELAKDENGFGFNIAGGTDEPYIPGHDGCFVTKIKPNGVAEKDGRLRPGDRIVAVDDRILTGITHDALVDVFKHATGVVKLLIEQDAELTVLSQPSTILPAPGGSSPGLIKSTSSETSPTSSTAEGNKENGMATSVVIKEEIQRTDAKSASPNAAIVTGTNNQFLRDRDPPVLHASVVPSYTTKDNELYRSIKSSRADNDDDKVSTFSGPPDDVPRTPKRPISILDPASPSVLTEAVFISIGVVALAAGVLVAYKLWRR